MEPLEDFRALKVVVLAGGDSSEWQISLMSGWQAYGALEAAGHQATWVDPLATDISTFNWQEYDACFIALHGGRGKMAAYNSNSNGLECRTPAAGRPPRGWR